MPTLDDLTHLILRFRADRHWEQFHNPKDVALSLTLEAAELLELTQWKNGDELRDHLAANKEAVGDELSDILGWILIFAHDQQIDLADAFKKKIAKNEQKYPVEKARGSARKYTHYENEK